MKELVPITRQSSSGVEKILLTGNPDVDNHPRIKALREVLLKLRVKKEKVRSASHHTTDDKEPPNMKNLQLFQNDQFGQVRVQADENGTVWFCGKDIAMNLEYPQASINQLNNLLGNVPEEWKSHKLLMTPGGPQKMLCLTEQGLYFFLGRSDKPKALPYQKWVAGEIIPSIRKTGGYKTKSRRSSDEVTARAAATSYRMMARMKDVYPPEMLAVFAAKSVNVLTGEPLHSLLPPVKDNRESWLSPTALAVELNVSSNMVGRTLKKLGLHGDDDPGHEWSQPIWNKSRHSDREMPSFLYKPSVVVPALEKALRGDGSQLN